MMTYKGFVLHIMLIVCLCNQETFLFGFDIKLFSISYNDGDLKAEVLYNTVYDEEAIKQKEKDDAIKLAALLKENKDLDHKIAETQQDTLKKRAEAEETKKRVARKKQALRKKLKEYICSEE